MKVPSVLLLLFRVFKKSNNKPNNIETINTDDIEYFTWNNLTFDAKPSNVYDGDTFSACWLYNGHIHKYRCRCSGYDSPEIKPLLSTLNREQVIRSAKNAKERFIELLNQDPYITIKCGKNEKYGRILVYVYNKTNGNKSLNQIMIDEGYGYVYNGGKKK